MNRRHFLSASAASGVSLLTLNGCSTLSSSSFPGLSSKPLVAEFDGKLNTAPLYWTNVALQAARSLNLDPLEASRAFAMAHFAAYLSLTGDGFGQLDNITRPSGLNDDITYGAAFSYALEDALDTSLAFQRRSFYSQHGNKESKSDSIKWAKSQAKRIIQWRTGDGTERSKARLYPKQYQKQNHALSWSPTGPFYGARNGPSFTVFERGIRPAWGIQKPWLIDSPTNFQAKPFPALDSKEFKRQFDKVKSLGNANNPDRTEEQNQIALFWEDGLMGITIVGHFVMIAMQLIQQRQLDSKEQAKLFALLSMAQADAGIIAWHNKYHFDIVRPETAIRYANTRFSATDASKNHLKQDSTWESYLPTPSFPTYISGHSIFGAAACGFMAEFFDTDAIELTSPAPDMVNWPKQLHGVQRSYTSLKQIAEENGMSREYGGVHWEIDNTEGLRLGYQVAQTYSRKWLGL